MNEEASGRLQQYDALFEEALSLPAGERTAFLERACEGDEELRERLEKLLAAHEAAGPFLEDPDAWLGPLLAAHPDAEAEIIGEIGLSAKGLRVGPYRVLKQIGRGGMGAVYLAEHREEQFLHQVAIKLVRPGLEHEDLRRRFLSERQILARLQHPNIARLLDAGVTEAGQPYFAMEYIDGMPINQYCDAHRLDIERRLQLFSTVCKAVQYAHNQLVIHRDLKPNNILVKKEGAVKLLDFGIAKLLEKEETAETPALTRTGMWVMTPEYASPEQVRGEAVSTASDVYALGIILYELLTGRRPYQVTSLPPSQMEQVICEAVPERPSTAVTRADEESGSDDKTRPVSSEEIGRARSTSVEKLRRRLSGDLDTIMLKALQKEPERRYASVEQFLEDIRRHQDGLPVRARPDAFTYRTLKFVRRHRIGAVASVLVFVSLVAGFVIAAGQARIASRERDNARLGEAKAEEVSSFLIDLFNVADPSQALGDTITAREILDRGADRIQQELGDQPDVQAALMDVMGQVYQGLGLYEESAPLLEEALAVRLATRDKTHPEVAQSLSHVARLHYDLGDYPAAESLYRETLSLRRALHKRPHEDLATSLHSLAGLLGELGKHDEAVALYREALAMYRSVHSDQHPDVAGALFGLATSLHTRGDFEGAEQLYREAVSIYRALSDEALHPLAATSLEALGQLRGFRRDFEEAEPLLREALAMRRRLYDPDHPDVLKSMRSLAALLHNKGAYREAEPLFREALRKTRDAYSGDHVYVRTALQGLAGALRALGRYREAEPLFREVVAMSRRLFGSEHVAVMVGLLHGAECHYGMRRYADAEARYREALDIGRRLYGEEHAYVALSLQGLARVHHAREDVEAAEPLYRQSLAMSQKLLRADHRQVSRGKQLLADLLRDQGRYAAADSLYREALDALRRSSLERHITLAPVLLGRGRLLTLQGFPERAEALLREALAIRKATLPTDHWEVAEAGSALGACLTALGRYEEAEPLLTEGYRVLSSQHGGQDARTQAARRYLVALYEAWGKPEGEVPRSGGSFK